jgi:hypothetical protein
VAIEKEEILGEGSYRVSQHFEVEAIIEFLRIYRRRLTFLGGELPLVFDSMPTHSVVYLIYLLAIRVISPSLPNLKQLNKRDSRD